MYVYEPDSKTVILLTSKCVHVVCFSYVSQFHFFCVCGGGERGGKYFPSGS